MIRYLLKHILRLLLKIYRRNDTREKRVFCVPGDHIGDEIFINGLYEMNLLHGLFDCVLGRFSDKFLHGTCLDVGANIGNHSLFWSTRFKSVYAFEPNPIFLSEPGVKPSEERALGRGRP